MLMAAAKKQTKDEPVQPKRHSHSELSHVLGNCWRGERDRDRKEGPDPRVSRNGSSGGSQLD